MKRSIKLALVLLLPNMLWAYDSELYRFKVQADKYETLGVFRPIGHDFVLDFKATQTEGFLDSLDEGDTAAKTRDATTIDNYVQTHSPDHKVLLGNLTLNIPLPAFEAGGLWFGTSIRAGYDVGAAFSLLNMNNSSEIHLYAKQDIKGGLAVDFKSGGSIFGSFYLYSLTRKDLAKDITTGQLITSGEIINSDEINNDTGTVNADLMMGVRGAYGKFWVSLEEGMIAKYSDNEATKGKVKYGEVPLYRAHYEKKFLFLDVMDVVPFLGMHKRSGYDFEDGFYLGTRFAKGDFPLAGLVMVDNLYASVMPSLTLGFFSLDYAFRMPIKGTWASYDYSYQHYLDLRMTF